MSFRSPDRLQQVGTVVAIILGIWGAGLSTYQEIRNREKEKPRAYTQLVVSRPDYVENLKSRPAKFSVKLHNSGQTPITFLPTVSVVVSNPGSGFSTTFNGQFASESSFSLPKTIGPGEHAVAEVTAPDSDQVFGPNMRYTVFLQSSEGQTFVSDNLAGPMKTAEGFNTLQKHVKYQTKAEFSGKYAVPLPR